MTAADAVASSTLTATISIAVVVILAVGGVAGTLAMVIINRLYKSVDSLCDKVNRMDQKVDRHLWAANHAQDPQHLERVWATPPTMLDEERET